MLTRINSTTLFAIGLFLALFVFALGLIPAPVTYSLFWSIEVPAAVFLSLCCLYILAFPPQQIEISRNEFRFVVLPMAAMIVWSVVSAAWASSWRSAIHHALVWCLYLAFYIIFRQIVRTERGIRDVGIALVIYLTLFSIVAVSGYISLLIFTGPNPLGKLAKHGEQIVTLLPLLLVYVVGMKGRSFWIGTAAITLLWLLVYCTLGRINLFLFWVCFVITAALILFKNRSNAEFVENAEKITAPSDKAISASPAFSAFKHLAVITLSLIIAPILIQSFTLLSETSTAAPMAVQRFSDEEGISSSNNFRRLMNSVSKEMITSHPIFGLGADNFGFRVNDHRRAYAAEHPDDIALREAEDNLPERAHNEFLQIAAELGIVGVMIVGWMALGLLILLIRAARGIFQNNSISRLPLSPSHALLLAAAVIGLGAFCVSSLVSSYSFRLIQNGFVFFFVLAIAWRKEWEIGTEQEKDKNRILPLSSSPALPLLGLAACLLMLAYWTPRLASVYYANQANYEQDITEAERLYTKAEWLDNENADAWYYHGMRLYSVEHRFADAGPYMAEAIRLGRGRSVDYSHLAGTQSLGGDNAAAERTMAEAFGLYPQAAFVMARYAQFLKMNGKDAESEAMLARARVRNLRDANAWWTLLTEGGDSAADKVFKHPDQYTPVMDLRPLSAVYGIRDERFIRFPEEKNRLDIMR